METSQLICFANHLTGLCVMATLGFKESVLLVFQKLLRFKSEKTLRGNMKHIFSRWHGKALAGEVSSCLKSQYLGILEKNKLKNFMTPY